jgi:glycosyltransferase involved in cell wall biosynthesis
MGTTISVIIPVKNEESKIETCLKAVFSQTLKPCEVIVVDGHSTDKTVENALKFPVQLYYEEYPTRAGANNVGIAKDRGDYIVFTDADCIPDKNWLKYLHEEFTDWIVGVGGGIKNIGEGVWEESINLVADTFLGSANSVQGRYFKSKRFVKSISGCNSMYRKKDLIACGGFNLSLSTAEDTDLNNRLLNSGKLLYTPNAVIYHNHMRGLKDFRKRMHQYGFGRAKSGIWDLQVIPPIAAFGVLLTVFISPLVFFALLGTYIVAVAGSTLVLLAKARRPAYLVSIPIVFLLEHVSYTIGFWKGAVEAVSRRGTQ